DLDMPLELAFKVDGGASKEVIRRYVQRIRTGLAKSLGDGLGHRCSVPSAINATFYHALYLDHFRKQHGWPRPARAAEASGERVAGDVPWNTNESAPQLSPGTRLLRSDFSLSAMARLKDETDRVAHESGYHLLSNFWLNPSYRANLNLEMPGDYLERKPEQVLVRPDGQFTVLGDLAQELVDWIVRAQRQDDSGARRATLSDLLAHYPSEPRRQVVRLLIEKMCNDGFFEIPRDRVDNKP
ncbi:unnamed protein product, partial [marine sediment metagenome]